MTSIEAGLINMKGEEWVLTFNQIEPKLSLALSKGIALAVLRDFILTALLSHPGRI
jgi:hypothetical protein